MSPARGSQFGVTPEEDQDCHQPPLQDEVHSFIRLQSHQQSSVNILGKGLRNIYTYPLFSPPRQWGCWDVMVGSKDQHLIAF